MTDTINSLSTNAAAIEILYTKLLGETASINWEELQPFFARGALLWVSAELDLITVAVAVAQDDSVSIGEWLAAAQTGKLEAAQAADWFERNPPLWSVVVAPWVLVQERRA